ncbi:uroporphyrinogen decarboxylase family protein [Candidatus Sumerlaeota bacterium]
MNSLERMMAAVNGEPFDSYPFVNPYPYWSMMPHWPELTGLTFLHADYGSDEERLRCARTLRESLGLDWLPILWGACGLDEQYRIETEDGAPTLVTLATGARRKYDELPIDAPVTKRKYDSAREVESLPPPATAEELLAGHTFDITRRQVAEMGEEAFLFLAVESPFSACFRALTFEGLYDAVITNPELVHAIAARETETLIQYITAVAQIGVHGVRMNEHPSGADLLSEKHYLEFLFPYDKKIFQAARDAGLVAILEYLGWVEPRLPHFAKLELNCLQTESSLKGYRNDIAEYRRVLGEEVCLFGNSPIRQVIELGDDEAWRQDAREQARGIGEQRRYAICAGSPTTWATGPERLRRFGEFMRQELAQLAPPRAG